MHRAWGWSLVRELQLKISHPTTKIMHAPAKTQHSQIKIHISFLKFLTFIHMQESPLQESNLGDSVIHLQVSYLLPSTGSYGYLISLHLLIPTSHFHSLDIILHLVPGLWHGKVSIGGAACRVTTPLLLLQDHTAMTEMTMFSHILAI